MVEFSVFFPVNGARICQCLHYVYSVSTSRKETQPSGILSGDALGLLLEAGIIHPVIRTLKQHSNHNVDRIPNN